MCGSHVLIIPLSPTNLVSRGLILRLVEDLLKKANTFIGFFLHKCYRMINIGSFYRSNNDHNPSFFQVVKQRLTSTVPTGIE